MSTETATHLYTTDELAWFAREYADTEWMVHVTGMDDCHLYANPDLEDDDPANPLLTEESATQLAKDFNAANANYASLFPDARLDLVPQISATVFHHGVPVESGNAR